ncbi:hypothetical protein B0H63DRAFT_452551 [Podospora didyma]|uniref:Uncharacterized protein n=1 Tax=Podospora didyma TaxID=330526 RepID=A0AAE0N8I4_9PEZI|nr:hypothetical protein B0H63DRAFT_452551 [Podospora didyma]
MSCMAHHSPLRTSFFCGHCARAGHLTAPSAAGASGAAAGGKVGWAGLRRAWLRVKKKPPVWARGVLRWVVLAGGLSASIVGCLWTTPFWWAAVGVVGTFVALYVICWFLEGCPAGFFTEA